MGEYTTSVPTHDALTPVCNIVTPVGMLGYGLGEPQTADALQRLIPNGAPTAIILDSGSTDSGPEKLATGCMTAPRSSYVRDLTKLLRLVDRFKVPLLFSSAGGDGSDEHVRELVSVVEEVAAIEGNEHYKLKTLAIFSGVRKSFVLERLHSGAITGCGKPVPALTEKEIDSAPRIVSQMGPEPFLDAMRANPDFNIVIGGRAYDPSPYVAFAAFASNASLENTTSKESKRLWGGFTHMGKIMECGGQCTTPKSPGAASTVYSDGTFDVMPFEEAARCTPISVAAHTLYEKTRPDLLSGPGGYLNLTASKYEQLKDGRTCRVRGGMFTFSRDVGLPYQVKLEGASVIGYRTMYMGSIKDPILISHLDPFLEQVKWYTHRQHEGSEGEWELDFHIYGQHQVSALPKTAGQPSEIFLIGESLASSQALATSVAASARVATVHGSYPDQKATAGNFSYGLGGKMEIELGPCAQFSIYHLVALKGSEERLRINGETTPLFSQSVSVIGKGQGRPRVSGISADASKLVSPKKTSWFQFPESPLKNPNALPVTLSDVARVLRSKNAGPFEVTYDVIFGTEKEYQFVKSSGILSGASVAAILGFKEEEVIWSGFFDQALAFKATFPRLRRGNTAPNGGFMEDDVHASQKHVGLLNTKLAKSFIQGWEKLVH